MSIFEPTFTSHDVDKLCHLSQKNVSIDIADSIADGIAESMTDITGTGSAEITDSTAYIAGTADSTADITATARTRGIAGTDITVDVVTNDDLLPIYIHRHHNSQLVLCCPQKKNFVTSFGIIAIRRNRPYIDIDGLAHHDRKPQCSECIDTYERCEYIAQNHSQHSCSILLLQRKQTNAYVDIIKGSYISDMLLPSLVSELTCEEKERIKCLPFEELWRGMWIYMCRKNSSLSPEYIRAYQMFKCNLPSILAHIDEATETHNLFTEFGFPKGRKEKNETGLQCAVREFCEEAGYTSSDLVLFDQSFIVQEEFIGSDNQYYRHVYYLAEIISHRKPTFNRFDIRQGGEIRNLGWFAYRHAIKMFRTYDITKLQVLKAAKDRLNMMGINLD